MKSHASHTSHTPSSAPFAGLGQASAPTHLGSLIHARIVAVEKRSLVIRASVSIALAGASFVALVWSSIYVWMTATTSGFGQYLSLIFSSDAGSMIAYSKELSLALIESLPALGIALTLSAGLVFVWSVVRFIKRNSLTHNQYRAYANAQ